jgi:hypothetical protein
MADRQNSKHEKAETIALSAATPLRSQEFRALGVRELPDAAAILPEQFFRPGQESFAAWTGERRLLLAVLEEALNSFLKYQHNHTRRGRRLFHEAVEWFWSADQRWLCSFETICLHLDLDVDYIRSGLQRLTEKEEKDLKPLLSMRTSEDAWLGKGQLARAA